MRAGADARPVRRGFKRAGRRSPSCASPPSRVLLDFRHFFEGLEHLVHDPAALVDVRQLAAPEEDVDQHLVLVFEELAGTLDLDLDVVVAGLGPDPDLLDLDLVLLLLGSFFFWVYLNLPKSMILQTGGRSLGATSTRSMPASRAASRALPVGMTPSMAPSALMTRTGEMRICSFTLKPRSIGPMTSSSGTVQG